VTEKTLIVGSLCAAFAAIIAVLILIARSRGVRFQNPITSKQKRKSLRANTHQKNRPP